MKKGIWIIGTVVLCFVVFAASISWAGGRTWDRQGIQQQRIVQGVRNGEISGSEYARLTREQGRIQRSKAVAWTDGHLGYKEQRRIEKKQNRASAHIHHARCNHGYVPSRPHDYCGSRWHRHPDRRVSYVVPLGSVVSGLIAQPGWAVAWTVNLD